MSWQTYVDDHLMCPLPSGSQLASAAITGLDGSIWAQSGTFPDVKPEEITAIISAFDDSSSLAQHGLFLGGEKYMVIQGEAGAVIRGKKGPGGVCIKKTGMAVLIGTYEEPMKPPECNKIVEGLGDYLLDQGC
ncbi:hypothetical protein R1sor_027144 [Riccia sorocarpa]|uniref:Profilin n=1 Tax=Riccia sorocarpa TaxID=122646 RepID=A0ABD3GEX0_9MARC